MTTGKTCYRIKQAGADLNCVRRIKAMIAIDPTKTIPEVYNDARTEFTVSVSVFGIILYNIYMGNNNRKRSSHNSRRSTHHPRGECNAVDLLPCKFCFPLALIFILFLYKMI